MLAFNSISKFKQYQTILYKILYYFSILYTKTTWMLFSVFTLIYRCIPVREIGEIMLLIGLPQIEIGFHYLNYWQLLWKFIVLHL